MSTDWRNREECGSCLACSGCSGDGCMRENLRRVRLTDSSGSGSDADLDDATLYYYERYTLPTV